MTDISEKTHPVLLNFSSASFLKSAPSILQCPEDTGAEVAFAGRSNAGKSSALNRLCNQPKLARTSKTPGRTQLINFFELTSGERIVDLPGYGFAKVPLSVKKTWEKNLTEYLNDRKSLSGCVLLIDIRHPLQEFDRNFIAWALQEHLPVHLLLTKADKIKRGPGLNVVQKVKKELSSEFESNLLSIQLYSALKGAGVQELKAKLSTLLSPVE